MTVYGIFYQENSGLEVKLKLQTRFEFAVMVYKTPCQHEVLVHKVCRFESPSLYLQVGDVDLYTSPTDATFWGQSIETGVTMFSLCGLIQALNQT